MTYTGAMTMPTGLLALPHNAVKMQEEELRYVEGGKVGKGSLYFFVGSTAIWWVGYCAKTPQKKWVTKNGKKYYIEYNPSKKMVKFGNKCCYVGNWGMGHISKLYNIISGVNGYLKLK